jgi:uncharacterized protein (TIGR00369 family)
VLNSCSWKQILSLADAFKAVISYAIFESRGGCALKERLRQELEDLTPHELATVHKMVLALKRARTSPLAYIEELMNFEIIGYIKDKDAYVHRMLITDELKNRYQMLHGGVTATFIDTAMGSTVFLATSGASKVVTLDLAINFLAPGIAGWLTAETKVVKQGRTIIVLEAKVVDEQSKLIASAHSTFFRLS